MKKFVPIILLFLMISVTNPLMSQDTLRLEVKTLNDSIRDLNKEIRSLDKSLKGKDKEIRNLNKDVESKDKEIKELRENNKKLSDYKKTLEANNKEKDNEIMRLNKDIESKEKRITELLQYEEENKRLSIAKDSLQELTDSIEPLKNEKDELLKMLSNAVPLVEKQLKLMATNVDKEWMSKPFTAINTSALKEELTLYETYKNHDKGVAAAYVKLVNLQNDVSLFQKGIEAVNSPYNDSIVTSLLELIGQLSAKEAHPERKAEIETLVSQLDDYKVTLSYFQKIVREIDKRIGDYKMQQLSRADAWDQIQDYLKSPSLGDVEKYMSEIPWLKAQYYAYIEQLRRDAYAKKNIAHDSLMAIDLGQ